MNLFAKFVTTSAFIIFSGVSLKTQAAGFEDFSFHTQMELRLIQIKSKALADIKFEIKQELSKSQPLFLGQAELPEPSTLRVAERERIVFNPMETIAD